MLNVVETNPFRHLNHLSLKFASASDAYLKKYLAECLLGLKVSEYQINLSTFWTICALSVPFSLIDVHMYSMIHVHVHVRTMYIHVHERMSLILYQNMTTIHVHVYTEYPGIVMSRLHVHVSLG